MFVELNVNIGINDLRVKIEKIKQKLATKKIVRVTIQINTRQSQVDAASALLLNFNNMIQADMYAQGKPAIFKQGSENPENVEEVESLEDLDTVNTDLSKQDMIEDEENLLTDPKVVVRQTFLPVRKAEVEAPVEEVQISAAQLTEEEIVQLIREKYAVKDVRIKKEADYDVELIQSINIDVSEDSALFNSEMLDKATRFTPQYEEYLRFRLINGNPHKKYRKDKSSNLTSAESETVNTKTIRNKKKDRMMSFTDSEDVQKDRQYVLPIVGQQTTLFETRKNIVNARIANEDKATNDNLGKILARK